jgi:hypothetical protein
MRRCRRVRGFEAWFIFSVQETPPCVDAGVLVIPRLGSLHSIVFGAPGTGLVKSAGRQWDQYSSLSKSFPPM